MKKDGGIAIACSNLRGMNSGHDSGLVGNLLGSNLALIHWNVKMGNFYR